MSSLVERLSEAEHPIEVGLRPNKTTEGLKECLDRGFVHIKFTNTRGGTELGVRLDPKMTDLSGANFDQGTGSVTLVGDLTLDYVKVRCVAQVDIRTLDGKGHLERAQ